MGKIKIAFCDTDDVYARRFAAFFRKSRGNLADIMIFSDREAFGADTEKNSCQIWALGEGFHSCAELAEEKNQVMLLVDARTAEKEEAQIEKYQEAQEVIRGIVAQGRPFQKRMLPENFTDIPSDKEVIGVIAPAGHRLLTPFCAALSEYLSQRKHVLYVNLSDCSGLSRWMQTEPEQDVTDLLYLCMEAEEGFSLPQIQAAVLHEDGLDYLAEAENAMLLYEADEGAYRRLLAGILADTPYDAVVLEMGIMHQGFFALLENCGAVFCLRETGDLGKYRMEAFLKQCRAQDQNRPQGTGIQGRMRKVELEVPGYLRAEELRMSCRAGFLQEAARRAYERRGEWGL